MLKKSISIFLLGSIVLSSTLNAASSLKGLGESFNNAKTSSPSSEKEFEKPVNPDDQPQAENANLLTMFADAKAYIKEKLSDKPPKRKLEPPKKVEVKKDKSVMENIYDLTNKWNSEVNKTGDKIHNFAKKYGLPFDAKAENMDIANVKMKWSLVDKDCKPKFDASFISAQFKNLLKYYKDMINRLLDPKVWGMWFNNTILNTVVTAIADTMCIKELTGGLKGKILFKQFWSKFSKCVDDKSEGVINDKTDTIQGSSNAFGKGMQIDWKKAAQFAASPSTCRDEALNEVFGKDFTKCEADKKQMIFGWFNGTANFSLKFMMLKFSAAQQECILNKYKSKIEISNVEAKYFSINKDTLNTTESDISSTLSFKGTPTSNIKTLNDTNSFVVTNLIPYTDSRYVKYRFLLKNKSKLDKIIISNIYYSVLRNWTDYVFNQNYGFVAVDKPEEGYKDAKIPKGRWGFSKFINKDRSKYNELGKFKDYFTTSIYDHCQNLVSKGTLENYINLIEKTGDDKLPLLKEKVYKDTEYSTEQNYPNSLPINLQGESILNFFLFRPKDNLKWVYGGDSYKDEIKKSGIQYNYTYDEFLITDMLQSCKNWATKYKDKLYEDLKEMSINNSGQTYSMKGENQKNNVNETYKNLALEGTLSINQLESFINNVSTLITQHEKHIQKILEEYEKEQNELKVLNKSFQ